MKWKSLPLLIVSGITISATIFAVRQGIIPNSQSLLDILNSAKGLTHKTDSSDLHPAVSSSVLGNQSRVFSDLSKPLRYEPSYLILGSAKLSIAKINLAADDTLEAPTDWHVAGWYHKSAKAGEEGNIIIDGHYDTNTGAPAAFWGLKNLKVNDTVVLVDSSGKEFSYRIEETFYVDINDPERTFIFEEVSGKSELTLITCGGVWNTVKGTYDKRLVVKASLVSN